MPTIDQAYRDGKLIMDTKQELADEIERLRAAVAWQSIDTAPKTGYDWTCKDFLAWCPDPTAPLGGDRRICWWEPAMEKWWSDRDLEEHPTHWQPLPPPPTPN